MAIVCWLEIEARDYEMPLSPFSKHRPILGKIMALSEKVMHKIFVEQVEYVLCFLHNFKTGCKSLEPFCFYGKTHQLEGGRT